MISDAEPDPETEPLDPAEGGSPPRVRILALWDDEHLSFLLPDAGTVTVGRGAGVELQVGDPSISRQHVRFYCGVRLRVEDLRSANGTTVRGRQLDPGEIVAVSPGDMIELGRTMLFVQRMPARARPVQICTHEYFEARVDDECGRAEAGGTDFAIVRVRDVGRPAERPVEAQLMTSLRPGDVLARYGPAEHELLWVQCTPKVAEQRAKALTMSLQRISASASVGLACSPRDGRRGATLLERASTAARGGGRDAPTVPPVFSEGPMENLRRLVERLAPSSRSVLILGETGVGKGLLAAELHRKSPRAAGPFVAINCAELTESLFETELFGYEPHAFTGAGKAKPGLIEMADGGTLLLDEIGEMPLSMQVKLLRVLEDREVRRVGGLKTRRVDLRLVSCTNRDLQAEVERGTFRRDLYFRVAVVPIVVPPLRERTGEIEGLARTFAAEAERSSETQHVPVISPEALAVLLRHPWPGNVRELRNVIEHAVVWCRDGVIRPENLQPQPLRTTLYAPEDVQTLVPVSRGAPESEERQRIVDALSACGGNQRRAAELLGMSLRTLVSRLGQFNLPRPRPRSRKSRN
jgi:two-component system response regulator AtoC